MLLCVEKISLHTNTREAVDIFIDFFQVLDLDWSLITCLFVILHPLEMEISVRTVDVYGENLWRIINSRN